MRRIALPLIVTISLTSPVDAQVSVDLRALDAPAAKPAPPPRAAAPAPAPAPDRGPPATVPKAAPNPPVAKPSVPKPPEPKPAKPAAVASPPNAPAPNSPLPKLPREPPPRATVLKTPAEQAPPPPAPPTLPAAPPAPPPAVALAPAPPSPPPSPRPPSRPLPEPVRLTFLFGETGLSATDEAAIRGLAQSIPAPGASSINVVAYAAGSPDDPSTARRTSLSRGMAVRSVLIANGVPSSQIYVRALGAAAADGPADRVELIVARIGTVTR